MDSVDLSETGELEENKFVVQIELPEMHGELDMRG